MKRFARSIPAVVLGTTLLACGAAPASVSPGQNDAATAVAQATLPPQATVPATNVVIEPTTPPQPTGVPATPTAATAAQVGQPFQLAMGQAVQVAGTDLTLTFADVTEDSRCPRGVDCAWAGQVIVVLDAAQGSQTSSPVTLTLRGSGRQVAESSAQIGDYTVQIVDVEPYPQRDTGAAAGEYVATLEVR